MFLVTNITIFMKSVKMVSVFAKKIGLQGIETEEGDSKAHF